MVLAQVKLDCGHGDVSTQYLHTLWSGRESRRQPLPTCRVRIVPIVHKRYRVFDLRDDKAGLDKLHNVFLAARRYVLE